jgi:hypothetical protein
MVRLLVQGVEALDNLHQKGYLAKFVNLIIDFLTVRPEEHAEN